MLICATAMDIHFKIRFDDEQLALILNTIHKWIVATTDDPKKIAALTEKLKQSGKSLGDVVHEFSPKP